MIFRELSNAVFRFVLRCAGAEIDGGGVFKHPPPPQQVVENSEAQQGAGPPAAVKQTDYSRILFRCSNFRSSSRDRFQELQVCLVSVTYISSQGTIEKYNTARKTLPMSGHPLAITHPK